MFELAFRRAAVCMADDAGNGTYTLTLPDGAALSALVDAVLRGDGWLIPYTGAHSCWRLILLSDKTL